MSAWGCWQCNRYGWCYLDKWCPPDRKRINERAAAVAPEPESENR